MSFYTEDTSRASSQNPKFAVRSPWPQTMDSEVSKRTSADPGLAINAPGPALAAPHLRRKPSIHPTADVCFRKRAGSVSKMEPIPSLVSLVEPAEPYLKATRLSDLSAMSELDLYDSKDTNNGVPEYQQFEHGTDNDPGESFPEAQQTTTGADEDPTSQLLPHLRTRKTCVGHPVGTFNPPGIQGNKPLPEFTSMPVPGPTAMPGSVETRSSVIEERIPHPPEITAKQPHTPLHDHNTMPQEDCGIEKSSASVVAPKPLAGGVNQWNSFAGLPRTGSKRPERAGPVSYMIPSSAVSGKYGGPPVARAPVVVDPQMEKALFFNRWPSVDNSRPTSKPRTVIIRDMPDHATLAMVSRICKGTGIIETISLFPGVRRALVWFIEADDAKRFYDKTSNGIVLHYNRAGKALKKTVFVEMRKEVDILPSSVRTKVTDLGHTRVIRVVGWERADLELALGTKDGSSDDLLAQLAAKCAYEGKTDRIEGVASHTNTAGHSEATLVFQGIKEAYYALGLIKRMTAFEACNVTFGRDP